MLQSWNYLEFQKIRESFGIEKFRKNRLFYGTARYNDQAEPAGKDCPDDSV